MQNLRKVLLPEELVAKVRRRFLKDKINQEVLVIVSFRDLKKKIFRKQDDLIGMRFYPTYIKSNFLGKSSVGYNPRMIWQLPLNRFWEHSYENQNSLTNGDTLKRCLRIKRIYLLVFERYYGRRIANHADSTVCQIPRFFTIPPSAGAAMTYKQNNRLWH